VIQQGDIYWYDLRKSRGSEPGYYRPVVIVQNNIFNRSAIRTVVACALTSQLRRGRHPGNVVLRKGEANLPKRSVVNVSQLLTLDKGQLGERIGTLPKGRVAEIIGGIRLLIEPRELP